jgi:hypothetical protein
MAAEKKVILIGGNNAVMDLSLLLCSSSAIPWTRSSHSPRGHAAQGVGLKVEAIVLYRDTLAWVQIKYFLPGSSLHLEK